MSLQAGEVLPDRLSRRQLAAGVAAAAVGGDGGAADGGAAGAAGAARAALTTTAVAPSRTCRPRSRAILTRQALPMPCRARPPHL